MDPPYNSQNEFPEPPQFRRPKISFKSHKLENLTPIPLSRITIIGTFQSLNQEDEIKRTRLDKIEEYYNDIQEIINSKVGGCSKKYNVSSISSIYNLIFGKKGKNKNDDIDEIVKYYRSYVPRINNNNGNTLVDTSSGIRFSQVDIPFFIDKKDECPIDGCEDSEDEPEF